jgi:hypothetical protein
LLPLPLVVLNHFCQWAKLFQMKMTTIDVASATLGNHKASLVQYFKKYRLRGATV